MKINILSIAIQDLDAGKQFYERQQQGLGVYFLDTLFSDIDSLLLHAGIHQQFFGYYRALSKRFPYAIYYRLNGEIIEIWRALDCRQKPTRTVKALQKIN
ncbi:MAG TPA: type II toxin-antitoxin system RelE/ParE family toxin [Novimethylophilus sp.]|jgi:plasmid stabilization system protein ParE|uniref:type II toxin-antitoxin system RelE/ParE family toxin n=1 Tax=Novimethylophilus sp. TaxID=2137426 RepID=UPI002F3E2B4F